ncbi:MAG TPA: AbiV family abortive infection protein [Blastocatellia bacterium]|nr:AbiV family abortive infection protein [Blastocatellia bacterium]
MVTVTAETLLQGAWYAMEQAGRLLEGAAVVADNGDAITGAVLAMFAREELGRSNILRTLADRVKAGEAFDEKDVRDACDDHVRKQSSGAVSTTLRTEPPSGIDSALRKLLSSAPSSAEWKTAKQVADLATSAKRKHNPKTRHAMRTSSLYVDLNDTGRGWRRPCVLDVSIAVNEITDAVNDYAVERDRLRDEVLAEDYPEMAAALASMQSKVTLPAPRWPKSSISSVG